MNPHINLGATSDKVVITFDAPTREISLPAEAAIKMAEKMIARGKLIIALRSKRGR